jgi:hypothetical protein
VSVQAGVNKSLIVASGRASLYRTYDSIVLCGGPVVVAGGTERLVIVCDGDLTVRGSIRQSILVARGEVRFLEAAVKRVRRGEEHYIETKKYNLAPDVRLDEAAVRNVVLAGGDVHVAAKGVICHSTVRTAGAIRLGKGAREWENELKERVADALAPVRFFTPKDAGLTVEPSRFGLRVSAVDRTKPFAQAGLRADDLVLALDGQPARTPDGFRRLLRRRVAEGGVAVLQVRRDGKTFDLRVPMP